LRKQSGDVTDIRVEYWAEMRYVGQSYQIDVPLSEVAASGNIARAEAEFHEEYHKLYAHSHPSQACEFIERRVRVHGVLSPPPPVTAPQAGHAAEEAILERRTLSIGGRVLRDSPIYSAAKLGHGHRIKRPAIIEQSTATILVPQEFEATVVDNGILLTRG